MLNTKSNRSTNDYFELKTAHSNHYYFANEKKRDASKKLCGFIARYDQIDYRRQV